jgi:hypothetical protein
MFVLINRIKDDSVEIKAEFILLVSNTNRSQKVAIKEALSELEDLKAGVPQGSVLGLCYF